LLNPGEQKQFDLGEIYNRAAVLPEPSQMNLKSTIQKQKNTQNTACNVVDKNSVSLLSAGVVLPSTPVAGWQG